MAPHYSFDQFFAIRRYGGMTLSPDGRDVAYVANTSGQFNLWSQPLAGGAPRQLTAFEEESVREAVWSPDGKTIVINADTHGNENYQLYRVPAGQGWAYPITHRPAAKYIFSPDSFSPDGRTMAVCANPDDPANMDVVQIDPSNGESRTLLSLGAFLHPAGWSPDGRHLLVVQALANTNTNVLLLDTRTGKHEVLTPHPGDSVFRPGPWKSDGSGFYLITDHDREFKALAFYRMDRKQWDVIEAPDWDVEEMELSHDGRTRAWVVNDNARHRLFVDGRPVETPAGIIRHLQFTRDGRTLAFYLNTPRRQEDLYVLDTQPWALTPVTSSMLGGIDAEDLTDPSLERYPAPDGSRIPALVYRPAQPGKRPCVLWMHGGPESQIHPMYSPLLQYLLHRGIGVVAPNIHGSTGYGKNYQKKIHRDWGGIDLRDMDAAARWMQSLDWVDPNRMAVHGGSYGGFASLTCMTRLPQYWACGVDFCGPANLTTFVRSVPPSWRRFMKGWIGDPDEDAAMLRESSPTTYLDRIRSPLMVVQGAKDPRVVKAESDQIVEHLRGRGMPTEYLVFDDEGHGFTKRKNELTAYRRIADFLVTHLKP